MNYTLTKNKKQKQNGSRHRHIPMIINSETATDKNVGSILIIDIKMGKEKKNYVTGTRLLGITFSFNY